MKSAVVISRLALADIDEQVAYLFNEAGESTAARFLRNLGRVWQRLERSPRTGHAFPAAMAHAYRWVPVPGFPKLLVFYRCEQGTVFVDRVLHSSRDIGPLLG